MMKTTNQQKYGLDILQRISVSLMGVLVLLTFVGANLHALLWQSSTWLVSTVLPAVVVDLTNDERAELNQAPLQRNATLDAAAKLKAQHMAKNEYFSHYSPDGVSPWYWFDQAGYVYAHAGENIAIHFTDSSEVVEAWMDSPTHRANIVNGKYTEIGVGTAKGTYDGYDTVYVVQLFGAPGVIPEVLPTQVAQVPTPAPSPLIPETVTAPALVATEPAEETLETNVVEVAGAETDLASDIDESLVNNDEVEPATVVVTTDEEMVVETSIVDDVVVVESSIATSSGLTIASIAEIPHTQAGTTAISMATQPNELLQWVYIILGFIITSMLFVTGVLEAKKLHYVQVAYSVGLLVVMGGLWLAHAFLTSGAVIV